MSRRAKKRKHRDGSGDSGSSGGGLLTGMRGGFKNLAGGGRSAARSPAKKALDILFWVLIIAALAFAFARGIG